MLIQKVSINPYKPGVLEYNYRELLTPYILQFAVKQLGLVTKVKIISQFNHYFLVNSNDGIIKVTAIKRICYLPYRHIFAVHCYLSLDLFFQISVQP